MGVVQLGQFRLVEAGVDDPLGGPEEAAGVGERGEDHRGASGTGRDWAGRGVREGVGQTRGGREFREQAVDEADRYRRLAALGGLGGGPRVQGDGGQATQRAGLQSGPYEIAQQGPGGPGARLQLGGGGLLRQVRRDQRQGQRQRAPSRWVRSASAVAASQPAMASSSSASCRASSSRALCQRFSSASGTPASPRKARSAAVGTPPRCASRRNFSSRRRAPCSARGPEERSRR